MSRWRLSSAAVGTCLLALWLANAAPSLAASLPASPPISQSAFTLEAAGIRPVDNDGRIPAPSPPAAPACSTTVVAPSTGAVAAVQARINSDVAQGAAFKGDTICLSGTFRAPIHIRSKFSTPLLTIARAPGASAVFDLTGRPPEASDEDPGAHDSTDVGAIEIGGSRDVEIYGLTVRNWVTNDPTLTPAGIYATTTRADPSVPVASSPCYASSADHLCSDIFLFDNTVQRIENAALFAAGGCGNQSIGAYGIAVKSYGNDAAQALQHVVIAGNAITNTITGSSETMTINGDVAGFLVAHNTIANVDNIGIDLIGWETGGVNLPTGQNSSQARNGLVYGNQISNVDTTSNPAYGHLSGGKCQPGDDQAGGLYVDGGSYLWLDRNFLDETNHGIELGAEHGGTRADHLLVTNNVVAAGKGTSFSASSYAGHAYDALLVGGQPQEGSGPSEVGAVYVHDNSFTNQSQFYNNGAISPTKGMTAPVVNLTGGWQELWLLGNRIEGLGGSDVLNPLLVADGNPGGAPKSAPGVAVDCNEYVGLSTSPDPAGADNFDAPPQNGSDLGSWGLFSAYRAQNAMPTSEAGVTGWDANGAASALPACPFTLPDDRSRSDGSTQVYRPLPGSADPNPSAQNPCYVSATELLFTQFTDGYNNDPRQNGSAGLYTIPATGGTPAPTVFASGNSAVNMPGTCYSALAPGGPRVAFAWDRQSTDNIWTAPLTGADPSNEHQLTCYTASNLHAQEPTWSADGKTIVYELVNDNSPNTTTLWTISSSATCSNWHPREIVGQALSCNAGRTAGLDNHQPAWAPNGSRIVFQSSASENADTVNLWTVQPTGCGLTQITKDPNQDTDASFSPDSTELVYSTNYRSSGPGYGNLFIIDAVPGATPTRLTSQCYLDGAPSFSPDGKWVSFETWPSPDLHNGEDPTAVWRIPATARPPDPWC